jgi:hypothetical protein
MNLSGATAQTQSEIKEGNWFAFPSTIFYLTTVLLMS